MFDISIETASIFYILRKLIIYKVQMNVNKSRHFLFIDLPEDTAESSFNGFSSAAVGAFDRCGQLCGLLLLINSIMKSKKLSKS